MQLLTKERVNQKARALPVVGFFMKKAVQRGATRLHSAIKVLDTARIMKKSIKFSMLTFFISLVILLRYAFLTACSLVCCGAKHILLVLMNAFVFFHKTEV